jgi:myo-inositol 2-dehydrogenase / D-chiro-inositol 1-dehydrogenase
VSGRLGVLLLSGVRHQAGYAAVLAGHPRLRILGLVDEPGVADWMHGANAKLAARLGVPYTCDIDGALARDDVQLVSVCPEPTRHARLAARAARAGKHVLVDKPMALTLAECSALEAAVSHGGGRVTFVHRLFSPSIQKLRSMIDVGEIGLPWAVHVTWLAAGGLGGATVEHDELVVDPALSGGGELANFLSYPVGTIRYLTGLEVVTVHCVARSQTHAAHAARGVEDFAVLNLALERGVMATITVGRLAAGSVTGLGRFAIRLHGSHASAVVEEERPRVVVQRAGRLVERSAQPAGAAAIVGVIHDLVQAIEEDREPLCGLTDGRAIAGVLEAAYASAREHRVVMV